MRGIRILLAEDNELNQEVAVGLLDGAEATIDIAENGADAVEKARTGGYDIVLMDMQMPVMDGLEATRRIRSSDGLRDLPIVAMTANAMAADREQCLAAGMNDHIGKPIDPDELYRVLVRWTKRELAVDRSAAIPALPPAMSPTDHIELPAIDGIDARSGLARTGGRPEQYAGLLQRFAERHGDNAAEIATALDQGDQVLAQRLAHTLKGVAATIGADQVSAAALKIETGLKDGHGIEASIRDLGDCLGPVVAAIRAAFPPRSIAPSGSAATVAECVTRLEALRTLLENDDGEAADLIAEIAPGLSGVVADDELAVLSRSVRDYDFAAALTTLNRVCGRLSLEAA